MCQNRHAHRLHRPPLEVTVRHLQQALRAKQVELEQRSAELLSVQQDRDQLHRELVDTRAALAQTDAERNYLRAQLAAIEAEITTPREKIADDFMPSALRQTGSPVEDSPGPANAEGGDHVEDTQAPRNVAESQLDPGGAPASSPCLPQSPDATLGNREPEHGPRGER